jgi:heavy metal-binding protein
MRRLLATVVCAALLGNCGAVSFIAAASDRAPSQSTASSGDYWCTMHPNVRGNQGDRCRICHMPLVPAPPPDFRAFDLQLSTEPAAPRPGIATRLRLTIRAPGGDRRVPHFEVQHERLLHLFVVSQDFRFFAHVHPALQADGTFVQTITLPHAGVYRLITDLAPTGAPPQMLQQTIVTRGYRGSLLPQARLEPDVTDKVVGGVRVSLSMPKPVSGREQLLTFQFADALTGLPISDLEPYLGAVGHLFQLDDEMETPTHSHPVADMSESMGPVVVFQALFPRGGNYRLWVQVQRHGAVLVAPFTVAVRAAE